MSKSKPTQQFEGTFYSGRNGIGFVRVPEMEHVIEIPAHATGEAFHRDRVRVEATKPKNSTGYTGHVLEVTRPSLKHHIGTVLKKGGEWYAVPTDRHNSQVEIILPRPDMTLQEDDLVLVDITHWTKAGPVGKILKILDKKDVHENFALVYGFESDFPEDVQAEADELAKLDSFDPNEHDRTDLRSITTFTIDPDDAKDFDDALSVEFLDGGMVRIGVHIADVAHYVRPGTALDAEALERGTSVYLVDRTIPMLPEILSNNLCSLRPNEVKRAFSVLVTLNEEFEITDQWFGRTWIESDRRFSYEEAQDVIEGASQELVKEILYTNRLAHHLREERFANGALALEKEELRFVLDENGKPLEVRTKVRKDAHKMIEELMLLANRLVSKYMFEQRPKDALVYRVHDRPELERVVELKNFLNAMDYDARIINNVIPSKYLRTIVEDIEDPAVRDAVSLSIARSMAKAIYTTQNRGHYGLGFQFYTHFTSPIRRYPDVMVHRSLWEILQHIPQSKKEFENMEKQAIESSARERDAAEAERHSIAHTQALYMEDKIGEIFDGMITGVMKSGVFVAERSTHTEGMARYRDIEGKGYWNFDEKKNKAINRDTREELAIGDMVRIELLKVDVPSRMIDWKITELPPQE
ncbi:VacB/RNase II family 3'-5' exoribonuclease [Candidatus Nomurabacteria bacterium]|nr:VacB/RNase II family 3'-5' exoribonuclease [Candidatus Nomurabacteria bacterium]